MKKTLIIITSVIMLCIMLVGCQATDMSITTSKELNKNLNLLMNTVNRLDTVDNDYLVSNDIYSLNAVTATAVPTPNVLHKRVLASNDNIQNENLNDSEKITTLELVADEVNLKEDLTEALKNELVNRIYCDEKGNCKICKEPYTCKDNSMCNSCNKTIICDSEGNCTSCNKQLILDNNNNCTSCKKSCISTTPNSNISTTTSDCLKRISTDNEKLKIQLLGTNNKEITANLNENKKINKEDIVDNSNDIIVNNNDVNDNYSNINGTNKNNGNTNKKQEHITKDIWDIDKKDTNTTSNKSDKVVELNTTNAKNNIDKEEEIIVKTDKVTNDNTIGNVDDNINNDNKYKIIYYSENAYFPDILRYKPRFINQINYDSANSNLNRYVNKLQKLYTMTADVVEANNTLANYKVIILDNIDEAKELNNCVLDGTCTPTNNQVLALNNYIADIKSTITNLRNLNGNLTNEINKISTNNTGISQSIDVTNSNYLKILNQIDTRISYHENAIATLEQIKYLLSDAQNNNSNDTLVEDLNKNQTVVIDKDVVNDTVEDGTALDNNVVTPKVDLPKTEDHLDNAISTNETITNDIVTNNSNNIVEETVNTNETVSNIDTYKNNDLSNVNSYLDSNNVNNVKDNVSNNIDENYLINDNTIGNNNVANNTIDNNNVVNNENLNNNIADDNIIENNTNIPQMVDGNNNALSSENAYVNNGNYNNGYNNTIISENNLDNNDLGNNSYRYDNNGTLYNNTNGYNNTGLNNINEKNNNVNTYKYNTLVDSINRGTINNGINTL